MWLALSYAIPPNLLMASSQLANVLFSVLVPSLPLGLFDAQVMVAAFLVLNGILSSSKLLFIIWNFNEDFHGGFQVGCRRIGLLESLRSVATMLSVILSYLALDFLYRQIILFLSLFILVLLFKAPHCYCSNSLPSTGILEGLGRKSFVLLTVSEMLNHLAGYSSQTYQDWYVLNGWSTGDIIGFSWITLGLCVLVVPTIFGILMRMSVWGPWAMRDFTCMMPPGSLLRALALYDVGYLHHRSTLFVAAIIASYCIDVLRSASVFASMMTILGNKWYALKGCYLVLFLCAACSAASPFVGHEIAVNVVSSSPFDRITLDMPVGRPGSLGQAIFWAVVPLSAASYLFQLMTLPFFNMDIMTFRGHGCHLPDGKKTGSSATARRVSIAALKNMRKAVDRNGPRARPAGGVAGDDDACTVISCGLGDAEQGSQVPAFRRDDVSHRRDDVSHLGAVSNAGFSRIGSVAAASELVSEIEQQIIFNLAERVSGNGSVPPTSRASSGLSKMAGPQRDDAHFGQLEFMRAASNFSSIASASAISEASESSDESEGLSETEGHARTSEDLAKKQATQGFGAVCAI